jgi:hypothetical protein
MPEVAGPALAKNERGRIKMHTSKQGGERIRHWMDENVAACWVACPRPADLEEQLVQRYSPPLNIEFCKHPFASQLSDFRAKRRELCV